MAWGLAYELKRVWKLRTRAGAARDPGLARVLSAAAGSPGARPSEGAANPTVRVLQRKPVSSDLMIVRTERPAGFSFEPGQHAKVTLGDESRDYSIASAPHEPHLEFFVEHRPGGAFTPRLWELGQDASLQLRGRAKGSFQLDPRTRHQVFVATVTGIAPFVSMLRDAMHRGRRELHFHVLHGSRHADELGYAEELRSLPRELVTYVPAVSQPQDPRNAGWTGATGRLDALVRRYLDEQGLGPDDATLYACGHPDMVATVRNELGARGYRVHAESYG
jgi:NAD(P)H-flavin reductase